MPRFLAALALALGIALGGAALPRPALSQGTVAGLHHWQIQVDNDTPQGHNWSFNAFYPQRLGVHAGDTITFRVAPNPNAFHHPVVLQPGFTPVQFYSGFMFPDPYIEHGFQTAWFNATSVATARPRPPCGRAEQPACEFKGDRPLNTAMLISPPIAEGAGNPSFTFTLDAGLSPGTYYFLCSVHGPAMQGHFDVLPDNVPVQSDATLTADSRHAYETDVERLAAAEAAILPPTFTTSLLDGRKTWRVAVGGGPETRLAINEFGARGLFINAGESVTWEVAGPPGVIYALDGFAAGPIGELRRTEVIIPGCEAPVDRSMIPTVAPRTTGREEPPLRFGVRTVATEDDAYPWDPDLWNTCPGDEIALVGPDAFASPPSGSAYQGGPITSGILMNREFLEGPLGAGLPFLSSYTLRFDEPGTYRYTCIIHSGMDGWITVRSRGTPPDEAPLP